ncbi:MAG: hypothetical protein QOF71_3181 [Candidatus Eremiobacteraeota bacterium]|nr:hypothetical protein [Candidatus Eremiobacteraeota bacterium]
MRKLVVLVLLFATARVAVAADGPVERWARAVGGRGNVAAVKSLYREGTLTFAGMTGSIKVWRTADGKYRKEEQVGPYSNVETFDGTNGSVQQGSAAARAVTGAELGIFLSKSFANWSAVFFVFFPERRHGTLRVNADDTIAFTPEGGIEWLVTLDPQTSLPKTMTHKEGDRTITVTFTSYETVGALRLEKELRRTTGDPRMDSVISFTKTVIDAPVTPALFSP